MNVKWELACAAKVNLQTGAGCSQQPAVVGSSVAPGRRPAQWSTQTAQSLEGHGVRPCKSFFFVVLKTYWERHWTCKEDVRSAACLVSARWFGQSRSWVRLCPHIYLRGSFFDSTLLWQTKPFILFYFAVLCGHSDPFLNCSTGRVMKNKLYYL